MMDSDSTDVLGPDRSGRADPSIDRYDLLLAVVPLALLGSVLAGEIVGVPLEGALFAGAAVATLAVLDGVFLRPPNDPGAV